MHWSRSVGIPRVRAKSLPVPNGINPMRTLPEDSPIPLITSFKVPSPPAATIRSQPRFKAARAKRPAVPRLEVILRVAAGRERSRSIKASGSLAEPAAGLRMIQVFGIWLTWRRLVRILPVAGRLRKLDQEQGFGNPAG